MFGIINCKKIKDLTKLQEIITLYNAHHPEQRVSIVPEKRDVSNLFVCSYNEGKVGLFKTKEWVRSSSKQYGVVFLGIDTMHVGSKTVWRDHEIWHEPNYTTRIDTFTEIESYTSTCHMHGAVAFEELRFMMRQEGLIQDYELGFASSKEILQVLDYATKYFDKTKSEKEIQKQK